MYYDDDDEEIIDQEQEDEDYDYPEQITPKSSTSSNVVPSRLSSKAKSAAKKTTGNIFKTIGIGFKSAMKNIGAFAVAHPYLFFGIILAIILLIACLWLLSLFSSDEVTKSVDNYVKDNIGNISSDANEMYKNKGSLILLKLTEVDGMYNDFLKSKDNIAVKDLKKKMSNGDPENNGVKLQDGAVSVNDNIELYKHILMTEKYNFNNVIWKQYIHDSLVPIEPEMAVNKEIGIQYPEDSDYNEVYFANLLSPYLQNWNIPLAMYAGSQEKSSESDKVENVRNVYFPYEIISKAYSNIQMNKYSLQTEVFVDEKLDYTENITKIIDTQRCTTVLGTTPGSGSADSCSSDSRTEYITNTVVGEYKNNPEKHKISVVNTYKPKSISAFDVAIEFEWLYSRYDLNSPPDSIVLTEEPYHEEIVKGPNTSTSSGDYSETTTTVTENIERNGTKYIKTKTWSDKLEQESNTGLIPYKIEDISEYEENLDKEAIDYYSYYADKNKLDRLDFINTKKDIYDSYVYKASGEYIGITKNFLSFSYSLLKKSLAKLSDDDGNIPLAYGQSLGLNSKYKDGDFSNIDGVIDNVVDYSCLPPGGLGWPVPEYVKKGLKKSAQLTSRFGYRSDPFGRPDTSGQSIPTSFHTGLDIAAGGSPAIVSSQSGKVILSGWNDSYGNRVMIKHTDNEGGKNLYTLYAHMRDAPLVREGQTVTAGQHIGTMGTTGNSTGVHLHFEVRIASSDEEAKRYIGTIMKDPSKYFDENCNPILGFDDKPITGGDSDPNKASMLNELRKVNSKMADLGLWSLQMHKDDDAELMARIIYEETRVTNDGAGGTAAAKAHCFALVNRLNDKKYGYNSIYDVLTKEGQFDMMAPSNVKAFNQTPPSWLKEMAKKALAGTLDPPPGLSNEDKNKIYFWIGSADSNDSWMYKNVQQVVGYKWGTNWHVFGYRGNAKKFICKNGPNGKIVLDGSKKMSGYSYVYK